MKCPQCNKQFGARVHRCPDCSVWLTGFSDPSQQIQVKAAWDMNDNSGRRKEQGKPADARRTEVLSPAKTEALSGPDSDETKWLETTTEPLATWGQAPASEKPGSDWLAPPIEPVSSDWLAATPKPVAAVSNEDWLDELLPEAGEESQSDAPETAPPEPDSQEETVHHLATQKVAPQTGVKRNTELTGVAAILLIGLVLAGLSLWSNSSGPTEESAPVAQQVVGAKQYLDSNEPKIAVAKAREALNDPTLSFEQRRDLKLVLAKGLFQTGEYAESVELFDELGERGETYERAVVSRDRSAREEAVGMLEQASSRLTSDGDVVTAKREAEYAKNLLIDHHGSKQQLGRAYYLTARASWKAGNVVAAESNMKRAVLYDSRYKKDLSRLVASLEPTKVRQIPKREAKPKGVPAEFKAPRKVRELPKQPYPTASPKPEPVESPTIGIPSYQPQRQAKLPAIRRAPQPRPSTGAPKTPTRSQPRAPVIRAPNIPEPSWKGDDKVYNGYNTQPWKKSD